MATLGFASCARGEAPARPFRFQVLFESDPGKPIEGGELFREGALAGVSSASGTIELEARGEEGRRVEYQVRCPAGHRAPERPLSVTLTRLAAGAQPIQYPVRCAPERRSVVIAVKAPNAPGLPIVHLGRELARLDESGAAHVQLSTPPQQPIELTIDTSTRPDLKPQNPSRRFVPEDRDALMLFEQDFRVAAPSKKKKRAPKPWRPVRIESNRR